MLTAVVIEGLDGKDAKRMRRDLVIGAMSEDHRVRILRWPGYPAGAPERRWEELGPVQELLTQGGKEAAAKTRGAPRRAASKRRATSNV